MWAMKTVLVGCLVTVLGASVSLGGISITAEPPAAVIDVRVDLSSAASVTESDWNTISAVNTTDQPMVNFATGDTSDGITASAVSIRGTIYAGTTTNNWQAGNPGPVWLDSNKNAAKDYFNQNSNSGMQLAFNGLDPDSLLRSRGDYCQKQHERLGRPGQHWRVHGLTTAGPDMFNSVDDGYTAGDWLTWSDIAPDANGTIQVQVGSSGGTTPNHYMNAVRLYHIALADAATGSAYSQAFAASGGAAPYSWSISSGTLPDGLTLSTAGVLSGTPTTAGDYQFTVQATDDNSVSQVVTLALTVEESYTPPAVEAGNDETVTLPRAAYLSGSATLEGEGTLSYTWSKDSGPGTVTFDDTNAATTTATFSTDGTYVLRLTVSDGLGSAYDTVTVTANPAAVVVDVRVDFSDAAAVTDSGWNTINATNAADQPMVNLATGDTSDGITASVVSMRGTIYRGSTTNNWQPTNAGPTWLDGNQNAAKDYFNQNSNSGMQLVFNGLDPNRQYDVDAVSAKNSTSGYDNQNSQWRVIGLSTSAATLFNSVADGYTAGDWISWTAVSPDANGTLKVQVGDGGSVTPNQYINAVRLYHISASSTVITTYSPLPYANVGTAYSVTFGAADGTAPYSWSVFGGDLPDGLSLSTGGVLSGTPTTPDAYTFAVQATDSLGVSDTMIFTMTVTEAPTITTQPQSQTVWTGDRVDLTIAATGSPAPTYQWKKNGTDIAGATGTTLTLNPVILSDAADYTCVVTNVAGTVTGNTATLTVNLANTAPTVDAGEDQTITLPATAYLDGSATDDGLPNPPAALTYTWSKDSGPGTVTFADDSLPSTTATFSEYGTYVLRLTASDSTLSGYDTVTIYVNPEQTVSLNIEDFNNTTDYTYTSFGGSQAPAGSATLTGWDLGGRYFKFEEVNGQRMMTANASWSGLDLGIKLAVTDNEYQPVWDESEADEAISLADVDQLQFQLVNRTGAAGAQGDNMVIYMYMYDTSESRHQNSDDRRHPEGYRLGG